MVASRAWTSLRWRCAVILLLTHVISPLVVRAQAPPSPELGQILRDSDRNRDGRLDREEFYRLIVEVFFFRDTNKDGYLVIVEVTELSAEGFRGADRDGDGRLSLQEYVNALFKDFDAADRDKDGVLTSEEIELYIRGASSTIR